MSDTLRIALAGNPNCGKTTVFNALTGTCQSVGNWPGVTVDKKVGAFRHRGVQVEVTDLPGVYGLTEDGEGKDGALDAAVARRHLDSGGADLVVNIVDAAHLERHLYLTAQILEMGVPVVVVLNMTDVAVRRGVAVDPLVLSKALGCPVVPMVGSRGRGLGALKAAIVAAGAERAVPAAPDYGPAVACAARALAPLSLSKALRALEAGAPTPSHIRAARAELALAAGRDSDLAIADARYTTAHRWAQSATQVLAPGRRTWTERLDAVALHRWAGIPVFLAVMYALFLVSITLAGAFIDVFDIAAGALFVDGTAHLLAQANAPAWVTLLLAQGVGGGLQTTATFIPIVGFLFLFLTFLEDSGYMARAAFVADRVMRALGLPGQAFVPMILGFGCTVPAVMAVRTLEARRARIAAAMMAPFMSCGARLPVYALFAAAFFPVGGQNVIFALYLIGMAFGVLTGLVLGRTLLRGMGHGASVMELPPYHWPTFRNLATRTWHRLSAFIARAGKMIVLVVLALSALSSIGVDGSLGNADTDRSLLAATGRALTPVVAPMGLTEDNWPATVALFTGLFAKEVVVGTLDALYTAQAGDVSEEADAPPYSLAAGLRAAVASIPPGLAGAWGSLADPLGLSGAAAEPPDVSERAFGAMVQRFDGQVGALAYLMVILLYMPCVAATAAILRETSWRWTAFIGAWSTGLGWGAAVVVYQVGTAAQHPWASAAWVSVVAAALVAAIWALACGAASARGGLPFGERRK
ncbi:MAG TPA: ferrous iron transporter B [Rhodospirillaceae bacterium]|nr:Fe(2+) transporter permease subunit FeoB [Alphaproteobacteria bacterium]HBH26072.1 ferrous iron transporter B [Rhodospirillaceae bacterium]